METPIIHFVQNYIHEDTSRFHMPGHKGHMFFGWEPYDITEIAGADVLHHGQGIIRQSEKNAALLFGSGDTHYSTEGSTHAIKAMLCILKMEGAKRSRHPYILAARNVHRSMVDACALLDLDVEFIEYSSQSLLSHIVTPEALEGILQNKKELPLGVYITSPDYLGQLTDIAGLSKVCKQYEIPLLVDNAHGAYLHFLPEPIHPMDLGAAMCSDSAHKTLPVLTGGAYLHIHREFTERFSPYASQALSLFGSTSPSYLTMQSLDLCNRYLAEGYREKLAETIYSLQELKKHLIHKGIAITPSEPLKLVIHTEAMGYTGEEIAQEMREAQIECEYADKWQLVLMITPENRTLDWDRLKQWADRTILLHPRQQSCCQLRGSEENIPQGSSDNQGGKRAMSLREAVFSPGEWIAAELAEGRICAAETVSCPPAVPIAISGEKISKEMVEDFLNAGIQEVFVVK